MVEARLRWIGKRSAAAAIAIVPLALAGSAIASCTSSPVTVPVRSFGLPQRVDFVCLQVRDDNGEAIVPVPKPLEVCPQLPLNASASTFPLHLYALVTQNETGEVAVVDLTAGGVIDQDRGTPGINFLPVGTAPRDIAVAPDGVMTYVASGDENKFAIYAIPSHRILGDSQGLPAGRGMVPAAITQWPVCSLPQMPIGLSVAKNSAAAATDGGTPAAYEIAVVLAPTSKYRARVATIDPRPLLAGAGLETNPAPIEKGSLAPCPVVAFHELENADPAPPANQPAAEWPDGIPYASPGGGGGGASSDLQSRPIPSGVACFQAIPRAPTGDAGVSDTGTDGDSDGGEGGVENVTLPPQAPNPASSVRDGDYLYVADSSAAIIHVFDLSVSGVIRELAPLRATSLLEPNANISVGALAISPVTREYKKYLYAIDQREGVGSIMVFDVTDPVNGPRTPLRRPHPELNPFQPPDRIAFGAPVKAVSFGKNEWPVTRKPDGTPVSVPSVGQLCNPNPGLGSAIASVAGEDSGAYYRANVGNVHEVGLGPARLRGIFGFAALSNGQIAVIDVDDWDAPCRRPTWMTPEFQVSSLDVPQTEGDATDPYRVPKAAVEVNQTSSVSAEVLFPISAPHRTRSQYLIRKDGVNSSHVPNVPGLPQLALQNAARPTSGQNSLRNPSMRPARTGFFDPSFVTDTTSTNDLNWSTPSPLNQSVPSTTESDQTHPPAVRLSFEDPTAHIDQDWTVTFEGSLPGFDSTYANIESSTNPDGSINPDSLVLNNPNAFFCNRGVEDWRLGRARVAAEDQEAKVLGYSFPSIVEEGAQPQTWGRDQWVADYVQVTDDLLPADHPYWTLPNNACWTTPDAASRRNFCKDIFAEKSETETHLERDFPILEAYDDRLVIGRYQFHGQQRVVTRRTIATTSTGDAIDKLRMLSCCFHNQVAFRVRTGGRWLALGSNIGYMHHVAPNPTSGRCELTCDARQSLLNSRAPEVPRPDATPSLQQIPLRDSPLALRNPMFSFVMWGGRSQTPNVEFSSSERDLTWKFTVRGQFTAQAIAIGGSSINVSPASMRFIAPLGQLAVVDGVKLGQGLVVIDLRSVALAHDPFF